MIAPVLAVHVAGLGDMLNHLARMHVLADWATSPALQRFYVVQWAPIPYLAMDAIVPLLLHVMPIYVAGRLFVALCLLMPPAGVAALHFAVHRRFSLIPAAAFLLSFNQLVGLGFLNYLFSSGVAVMLFAGWIAAARWPRWWRAVIFMPLVVALYFGHVFACLAYCLCVAGWEGARALRAGMSRGALADVTAAALQAAPAMVLAATLDVGAGYVGRLNTVFGGVAEKLVAMTSPMLIAPDAAGAAVLLASLAVAAVLTPRLRLAAALLPAAALVGACALAVPHLMASTWGTDLRLPLVAAMVLLGGLSWRPAPDGGARAWALAALCALVAVKSADAWRILDAADRRIAQTRAVLADLPRGARLLVVNAPRGAAAGVADPSTQWQMPMVAVIDQDAFVPYFFSGLSTVHVRPDLRDASTPNGFPITPAQLREGEAQVDQPGQDVADGPGGGRLYHFGWARKFDYVLVQRFGTEPGALPARLALVTHAPDMDLYRTRR